MRAAGALATLGLLLVSGCFQTPLADSGIPLRVHTNGPLFFDTPTAQVNRSDEQIWVVFITGTEEARQRGQGDDATTDCDPDPTFEIDPESGRLEYDATRIELDTNNATILVVTMFWADTYNSDARGILCASHVRITEHNGTADATVALGQYGKVRVRAFPQGIVGIPGDYVLPLGKGARFEYVREDATRTANYWVVGEWAVANLGAWPKANVHAEA